MDAQKATIKQPIFASRFLADRLWLLCGYLSDVREGHAGAKSERTPGHCRKTSNPVEPCPGSVVGEIGRASGSAVVLKEGGPTALFCPSGIAAPQNLQRFNDCTLGQTAASVAPSSAPVTVTSRGHFFQHDFGMPRGHAQEDPRRAGGFAPALFPVVQGPDRNAEQLGKFALRQLEF